MIVKSIVYKNSFIFSYTNIKIGYTNTDLCFAEEKIDTKIIQLCIGSWTQYNQHHSSILPERV